MCLVPLFLFIARAGLTPYNIERKRGELNTIINPKSLLWEIHAAVCLRSEKKIEQLRNALPWLQVQLPQLEVITANIQPIHMAILEGEQEVF